MDLGCKPVRKRAADTVAAEHTAAAGIAVAVHTVAAAVAADTVVDTGVVAAQAAALVVVQVVALAAEPVAVQVVVQVAASAVVQVAAFLLSKPCIEPRVAGIQVRSCPQPAATAALPGLPCPAVGMCQLYLELHP